MNEKWQLKKEQKEMFGKDWKSGKGERQFDEHWRVRHPRGLIRISSKGCFSPIPHHSRMSLVAPIALGVSFLLCASVAKQRGNYANNERLIKSRFRRSATPRLKNKIYSRKNTKICQTEYYKTLDMLSEKIRTLGIICT